MILRLLYNLVFLPILLPVLAWRLWVRGKSREGLGERFGSVPVLGPAPAAGRIWVHAVSLGETVAATPVVAALRSALPGVEIVFSTTTPTGQAQARRALPEAALHFYAPFDLSWIVERVLTRLQPTALVLMEGEIWPNLLAAARRRGVPVIVANGHISDRTFRRALRLRPLLAPLLGCISHYAAQSEAVRQRAVALGLPERRVTAAGHTKFDQEVAPLSREAAAAIRSDLGLAPGQPLFLAGSTHEGEEELLLDTWQTARASVTGLALMLAPRHLDRVDAIAALIEQRGLIVRRRTGSHPSSEPMADALESPPVILLDTMGELATMYGLATVAFVGGSLVPKGGHDILQPLFHGVPTLFGPFMQNQRALAPLALSSGAVRQVTDATHLAAVLITLISDRDERTAMQSAAAHLLAENRGASARCAAIVRQLVCPSSAPALTGAARSATRGRD